jgi:CHAT domain-containing protein/tetratricopeptide (TPR) repeat protein
MQSFPLQLAILVARDGTVKCADRKKMAEMEIANQRVIKFEYFLSYWTTSRLLKAGLLLCFAFFSPVFAQNNSESTEIRRAQAELDNGHYTKAVEVANTGIEKARRNKNSLVVSEGLNVRASSEISLGKYEEAGKTLDEALQTLSGNKVTENQKALLYIHYAWLFRTQRKFSEAFDYSKKAIAAAPESRYILAAHYLNTGRILFASGYDISAIIWLEKAEKLLESEGSSPAKIDTYRFLSLAWWSRLDYPTALKYAEKCVSFAENTQFKYKHRQGLFDQATILSESGQVNRALLILEKGLKLSEEENDSYQAGKFLTSLFLHALDNGNTVRASDYLDRLEKLKAGEQFSFEIKLGRAIVSAFQGQSALSEKLFAELEKQEKTSDYILPYWKIAIAARNQNWEQFVKINEELLNLTIKDNFRSGLPTIYLNLAKGYFRLDQRQTSIANLEKTLAYVEEIRKSENYNLSLGLSETYHNAYRLLAQIKFEKPQEAFELADLLKARLLKDQINNAAIKTQLIFSPEIRKILEDLSLKFIDDQRLAAEIEKNEKLITRAIPELDLAKPDLTELDKISDLENAAVVSYFFSLDKKLTAFVWEKGQPLKTVYLTVSEDEIDTLAKTIQQKIKNFIFFKRDGKELYDKLLKPLNLSAKHLIIVPDKSLWKIPFQALSPDGEKYLIEEKTISYAPSISILLEQLKSPKPVRQTMQAFANSNYDNRILQYVNAEALRIAEIYDSKPLLNATIADYERNSERADILHFSMHAEVDSEQPLESFLGFRKFGKDDGRLTVEEHLKIKLKKGSLVFLASCETNNVLNGEGLVSLAWAMMGSGATTVISAQWETDDKSAEIFTKAFYRHYKQGNSSAEALQKAALELIKNKSNNMHEPYYWADFTLNGDFR